MQIIPRQDFWGDIGTGLGQLAAVKLSQLSKAHQQKQERSQFAESLAPILGRDTASFLSNLGPDERKSALQNISSLVQLNPAPSSREQASQVVGMGSLQQLQQPEQQQLQQELPQNQQQLTPDRARLVEDIFISPQEKRERKKLELAERQANLKERQANLAATKSYVDELKNKEKAVKENNLRLKRMETLIDKGHLPNANLWSFLSKVEQSPFVGAGAGAASGAALGSGLFPGVGTAIGAGIGGLAGALTSPFAGAVKSWIKTGSPDIEEFEKLSSEFVKNAKQYFGSRITEKEVEMFMQTVPTLMQTDAGKKKVIENIQALNELTQIEAKAARSIIQANGGIPPIDIEQQVQDKIGDKIDKVAKKFIVQ